MGDESEIQSKLGSKHVFAALALVIVIVGLAVAYRISTDHSSPIKVGIGTSGISTEIGGSGTVAAKQGGASEAALSGKLPEMVTAEKNATAGEATVNSEAVIRPGSKFAKLNFPQGYIYYEVNEDDEATKAGSLARRSDIEYPIVNDINVGDILISTNSKTFRTRPFGAAVGRILDSGTCFRVIDGERKAIPAPSPIASAAWIPAENVSCS